MKYLTGLRISFLVVAFLLVFQSCEKERPSTKSLMEGTWELTEAYDEDGDSIINQINFPVTAFHLSSDNGIVSTGGPMFMYIVYGDNKYTDIAAKIDQVFNYAKLDFNHGEWFIEGGPVERFTIEMKLEGLPGQKSLTTLLDALGITEDYLDVVVYHKFLDVSVTFPDDEQIGESDYETMVWEFDSTTTAEYNTKDSHGNYVSWEGWPTDNFSRARFIFQKRSKDLEEIVKEHS
jgi:hypothetical protein